MPELVVAGVLHRMHRLSCRSRVLLASTLPGMDMLLQTMPGSACHAWHDARLCAASALLWGQQQRARHACRLKVLQHLSWTQHPTPPYHTALPR